VQVELTDDFWAPRLAQLRDTTLGVMLERMERQGAVDNFRRLVTLPDLPHRAMHFADSDLFKWLEAAALAGEVDRYTEVLSLVEAVQAPDGYVGTYYGHDGHPARYSDLAFGHEHYCMGHLIEAAISHHQVTGSDRLLSIAVRTADHLLTTFGPGRDERTDAHPEIELALCRLATATGDGRYVEHAAWVLEQQLSAAGTSLESFELGGHAVRALYLTSGIAEVALATGEARWEDAARRTYDAVLDRHSYPTGAVGGRWLGEAIGRPFEQPDAAAYAESCAAVAAAQLAWRMWRLTADPRALDHLELLLFNAVPCGVGADGASWFYSQPHAVAEVAPDHNLWTYEFDYGQNMLREWFPARRHRWFDVPCCPPNLARAFASVPQWVAEMRGADLLVHLPLAGRLQRDGWDVTISGGYPDDGHIQVTVDARPDTGHLLVRRPGWAGGSGHEPLPADGLVDLPVDWAWWTTDHRVEGGATLHVRRGPVVHCVEGVDHPMLDLRDLAVDPTTPPPRGFRHRPAAGPLHRPWTPAGDGAAEPVAVSLRPYATWANREPSTLAVRFPVVE
jgi:uncharacterized protein